MPRPGVLSTSIVPPRRSTNCLTMYRPSPTPPRRRVGAVSTWRNMSKMTGSWSGAMPIPVSLTSNRSWSACGRTCTVTVPSSVNLRALLTRLRTTSATLARSVVTVPDATTGTHSRRTCGGRGRPSVLASSAARSASSETGATSTIPQPTSKRPTCSVASISSSSSRLRASSRSTRSRCSRESRPAASSRSISV